MKDRIPNALKEVWEWKKAVYNEVKDMELSQQIKYILKKSHKEERN